MHNIWDLLLLSVNISIVAAVILLLKHIFRDLLSARWQYGIWVILFLRIILPFSSARYIFLPASKAVEMIKFAAEAGLDSAFTDVYSLVSSSLPFPIITAMSVSFTDWLFVIYALGTAVCLVRYTSSYIRLRLLVKKGTPVPDEVRNEIKAVAEKYNLKVPERIVYIQGLPSAFICGVLKPILVLPEGKKTDEKIILHELLHLKYGDTAQNVVWCILRCLNWFNPFMQYTFNRINNDIEALCDRRVLERLEGEERREYGGILLSAVNERYQRVPGTSSLANGGKNIARRISAIVKFKKFPKGTGLVSVCIIIMLSVPCLYGSAASLGQSEPENKTSFNLAVASARSARCTTLAGAIDTFAKAIAQNNGILLLTATPAEKHPEIIENTGTTDGQPLYYYETGIQADNIDTSAYRTGYTYTGYVIYNLRQTGEKKYSAQLAFTLTEDDEADYKENLIVPIEIGYENGWVITDVGESYTAAEFENHLYQPNQGVYEAEGKSGKIKYAFRSEITVETERQSADLNSPFRSNNVSTVFDNEPILSASFNGVYDSQALYYEIYPDKKEYCYGKSIVMLTKDFDTAQDYKKFQSELEKNEKKLKTFLLEAKPIGATESILRVDSSWDGNLTRGDGGGFGGNNIKVPEELKVQPEIVKVWVFSAFELIDEFTFYAKEETQYDN